MAAMVSSTKELLASLLQRLWHSMQNFNGSDQPLVQDPRLLEPLLQPMVQVMQESAKLSGLDEGSLLPLEPLLRAAAEAALQRDSADGGGAEAADAEAEEEATAARADSGRDAGPSSAAPERVGRSPGHERRHGRPGQLMAALGHVCAMDPGCLELLGRSAQVAALPFAKGRKPAAPLSVGSEAVRIKARLVAREQQRAENRLEGDQPLPAPDAAPDAAALYKRSRCALTSGYNSMKKLVGKTVAVAEYSKRPHGTFVLIYDPTRNVSMRAAAASLRVAASDSDSDSDAEHDAEEGEVAARQGEVDLGLGMVRSWRWVQSEGRCMSQWA
jgi:hypothetical protein